MDMKVWCKAANKGFKMVNVIWLPPNSPEGTSSVESSSYTVFFTTDILGKTEEYQFGCSLDTTQQSLQQVQLQCSISSEDGFPWSFYFILKMTNSSGSYVTRKKSCRLVTSGKL